MNSIKRLLLAVAMVIFCLNLSAQEKEIPDKKHFELVGNLSSTERQKVQAALDSYGLLDAYRLDDQRRTIAFEDGKLSVVLYSNHELSKPTGNGKRPALKAAPHGKKILFGLTPKGKLKVINSNE